MTCNNKNLSSERNIKYDICNKIGRSSNFVKIIIIAYRNMLFYIWNCIKKFDILIIMTIVELIYMSKRRRGEKMFLI